MRTLLLAPLLALAAAIAPASASTAIDTDVIHSPGFLRYHPDLRYQRSGVEALEEGRTRAAFEDFRRAARFGNKLAQAMVGEMYWTGQGVARDRALGYAWMDLAAERGYAALIGLRERWWAELDAAERERAVTEGRALYDEFGDDAAKPRLEARLQRGLRRSTGSRLGANASAVDVYTDIQFSAIDARAPFSGMTAIRATNYYADRYWKPRAYWRWQDRLLNQLPQGAVTVLPVQPDPRD